MTCRRHDTFRKRSKKRRKINKAQLTLHKTAKIQYEQPRCAENHSQEQQTTNHHHDANQNPHNMPLTSEHQYGVSIPKQTREGQVDVEGEANILRPTIQMQRRTSETLWRGIKRREPAATRKKGGGVRDALGRNHPTW